MSDLYILSQDPQSNDTVQLKTFIPPFSNIETADSNPQIHIQNPIMRSTCS